MPQMKPTQRPSKSTVSQGMRARAWIVAGLFVFVGFGLVTQRLVKYQIIETEIYKAEAAGQQLMDEIITPHRGTIYDANMKILAQSATVWTVVAAPRDMEKNEVNVSIVAIKLAEILEMPAEELMQKMMDTSTNYKPLKMKVEMPQAKAIEQWLTDYNKSEAGKKEPVSGISLLEGSKRYYPYGNFASSVIGFTNVDGDGLLGLELYYNDLLKGTPGRILTAKNALGLKMGTDYQAEYPAKQGSSLVLTLNENIQSSLEKHLGNAVSQYMAKRGIGIVMDIETGGILGMATLPAFDLNDPFTLYDTALAAEIAAIQDEATRTAERQKAQQQMWRNKAIQDIYEPGSVFKVITSAMALDSGKATINTTFQGCTGKFHVTDGVDMRCAKSSGHGVLTLAQGLDNSCNPYYIQLGQRIGATTFCDYLQSFGFTEKTGIDMQNEGISQTYSADKMGIVEISSSSYGQSSTVTPIAMITAFAAAVNGGNLVQPYVVQQVLDGEGNIVENKEPVIKRQVVSEETSATLRGILQESVNSGHGINAKVDGYRVGGKSGTSQKLGVKEGNENDTLRLASFCGFAPADDPKVIILILIDEPGRENGTNSYGGQVSAPVVNNIISEIMPYLGVEPEYTAEELERRDVTVPAVEEKFINDAQAKMSQMGLNARVEGTGEKVTHQFPAAGSTLARKSTVILYTDEGSEGSLTVVPNVTGKSYATVTEQLKTKGLNIKAVGAVSTSSTVLAVSQSIGADEQVPMGTIITVEFKNDNLID